MPSFSRRTLALILLLFLTGASGALAAASDATISGRVHLQSRTNAEGVALFFDGVPAGVTGPSGDFTISLTSRGAHLLTAKAPGYVSRRLFLDDPLGSLTLPPTILRAGDTDGDDDVDLADLLVVTYAYGTKPPRDPRADLDGDGEVGISDIVAIASNYNAKGPLPWTDESSLIWASRAALNVPRAYLGVVESQNRLYAIGGCCDAQNRSAVLNTVEEYNPAVNAWLIRASLPTPRSELAVAAVDGKIYAIGGKDSDGKPLAAVEEYSPINNGWTIRAAMPTPRYGLGVAVVNGKIYAIGGEGKGISGVVEVYDPVTNTWTTRASMTTPRAYLGVAARGSLIYAVGGWDGKSHLATHEMYDPATDTWTTRPAMPTPRSGLGLTTNQGRLYALGGQHNEPGGDRLVSVEAYDPIQNQWTLETNLSGPRFGVGAATLSGRLYLVGGYRLSALATVEEASATLTTTQALPKRLPTLPEGFPVELLPKELLSK